MKVPGKVGILLVVCSCLPLGRAAEDEQSVVDRVRAAAAVQGGDALRALAARDDPDPWVVVDELLAAGDREAAAAFAAAAPRAGIRRLPDYARAWAPRADEAAVRAAFAAALADDDTASRLARLEALGHARDDALEVRIQLARGHALGANHALLGSAGAFELASEIAGRVGWRAAESDALYRAGNRLYQRGDFKDALGVFRRRLAVERALRDDVGIGRGHFGLAVTFVQLVQTMAADRHFKSAREFAERAGDHEYLAKILGAEATALARGGHYPESFDRFEQALRELDKAGDRPLAARFTASPVRLANHRKTLLLNASSMAGQLEDWVDFERYGQEAMELVAHLGDERLRLETEAQFTTAQGERARIEERYLEAEEAFTHALALQRKLEDRPEAADLLRRIATVQRFQGDCVAALDMLAEAETLIEETGARRLLPGVLLERGGCLTWLGEYEPAHESLLTALDLTEELGLPLVRLDTLVQLGHHHLVRGEMAEAVRWFREAEVLELPPMVQRHGASRALEIGNIYQIFGDDQRALELYEGAEAALSTRRNSRTAALARRRIMTIWIARGEYDRAQEKLTGELEGAKERGDRTAIGDTLDLLGHLAYVQARLPDALAYWLEAEAVHSDLRSALLLARTQLNLVRVHIWSKQYGEAQRRLDQALEAGERLQLVDLLARAYGLQALVYVRTGNYEEARRWARRGVEQALFIGRRLAHGEGAEVRSGLAELYEAGALAAARSDHAEDLFFFLESARAATLLESLDGGEAVRQGAVSTDLRRTETAARTNEVRALSAYRRARRDGSVEKIREARQGLVAARERLFDVITRVERDLRVRGSTVIPRPVSLAAARALLEPGEVLVLYGLALGIPKALIVGHDGERIVHLGRAADLQAEVAALVTDESPFVHPEAIAAVSARLITKLELEEDVSRLLISPNGELARVPFGLLAPEREVVFVPSASAWTLLESRTVTRGERVLAYGDPVYTAEHSAFGEVALRRGELSELARLPATAAEVSAVGDLVRLRGEATETRLRQDLATGDRWRAVHLACHGLLDLEHPSYSSLALSTDEANDGFLTALDVYRLEVSTDLAVLSGCETGRGRNVGGEGLFGLPRAFLHAGASTVLVSLWPVDDQATQALMTRFYAAWAPKQGDGVAPVAPVAAPAALRQAQAWVRAQPKWQHPRFWSGWVLWGRAD